MALFGVVVRMADEYRCGLRDVSPEKLCDIARAWAILNAGESPAEIVLRMSKSARTNN